MAKKVAKGSTLNLTIATVLTPIVQLKSINGPGADVQTYDATTLDSGVGMEFEPTGHVDGGSVSFAGLFDPTAATHQALTDLLSDPAVVAWEITYSDTTDWPFNGILKKFEPKAEVNGALEFSGEIKLDGLVTYPT